MKILKIRLKNLRTVLGDWEIDLTAPEFVQNGIFAITGPTGAGKTTILDAICAALYGATPRHRSSKDGLHLVSNYALEAEIDVVFEVPEGQFRAEWRQWRKERKLERELATTKQQLVRVDTGEIVAEKIVELREKVEELTGLNFDRFTRSMMLPQGDFTAFIHAKAQERSEILEQVSGTRFYSDLSKFVYQQTKERQDELSRLQDGLARIKTLESEELEALKQEQLSREATQKVLGEQIEGLQSTLQWFEKVQKLRDSLEVLQQGQSALNDELKAFEPEREVLAWAQKAATLDEPFAKIGSQRELVDQKVLDLKAGEENTRNLEAELQTASEALQLLAAALQAREAELVEKQAVFERTKELDTKIQGAHEALTGSQTRESNLRAQLEQLTRRQTEMAGNQTRTQEALAGVESWLLEQQADEALVSGLAVIEERLNSLITQEAEILRREEELEAARAAWKVLHGETTAKKQALEARKQAHAQALAAVGEAQTRLANLLQGASIEELETALEATRQAQAKLEREAGLEELRAHLHEGESCPLCGALEHPGVEPSEGKGDALEARIQAEALRIRSAHAVERELAGLQTAEARALAEVEKAEAELKILEEQQARDIVEGKRQGDEVTARKKAATETRERLTVALGPLGVELQAEEPAEQLLTGLQARQQAWAKKAEEKKEMESTLQALVAQAVELGRLLGPAEASLKEATAERDRFQADWEALVQERRELFGEGSVVEAQAALQRELQLARQVANEAQATCSSLSGRLGDSRKRVAKLGEELAELQKRLAVQEAEFLLEVQAQAFVDEAAFRAARRGAAERAGLQARATTLDQAVLELQVKRKTAEEELQLEQENAPGEQVEDEVRARWQELVEERDQGQRALGELAEKLRADEEARVQKEEESRALGGLMRELERWNRLNGLVGQADGTKYKKFAQALTFQFLINFSNVQMAKLSDRYILRMDPKQELGLEVLDNYQAGESRPLNTLSGGETFLVSLAMALGLATMMSDGNSLDSLFLDEGFGTLDEDTLQKALEALSTLQGEGKMIGLISHVDSLKEQITTQIKLVPIAPGRSKLAGTGVTRLG